MLATAEKSSHTPGDGGPAFPTGLKGKPVFAGDRYEGVHVPEFDAKFQGMSLRDWFAAHTAAGLIGQGYDIVEVARLSYATADALLGARGRP